MPNQLDIIAANPLGSIQDYRQQLAETSIKESQAQIQGINAGNAQGRQALEMAGLEAETQQRQLANKKLLQSIGDDAAFREALSAIDPALPVVDKLEKIATTALGQGKLSEAEGAIKTMDTINNRESLKAQREAQADLSKVNAQTKRFDRMLELMRGMVSPLAKQHLETLYEQEFGQPSPTARFPFSPALRESAVGALTKEKSAVEQAALEALATSRIANSDRGERRDAAYIDYLEKKSEEIDDRIARGEKTNGKVATPTKADKETVGAKLRFEYPGMPLRERELAAAEVASDAKAIQLRDGGSFADAMNEALNIRRDQFVTTPGEKGWIGTGEPRTSYTSGAPTKTAPLDKARAIANDMNKTGIDKADLNINGVKTRIGEAKASRSTDVLDPPSDRKFEKGRLYRTPKGVLLFTGTGFRDPRKDSGVVQ